MSQERKIEEQRTVHLRQKLEKREQPNQETAISKFPVLLNYNLNNNKTLLVSSERAKLSVKVNTNDIVNDSDSAINTDSGSESGKLSETGSAKLSQQFPKLSTTKLSRSLSDLHVCKKLYEQYISQRRALQHSQQHSHALYPNHRRVQRPRDVKKRHWRKSFLGFASSLEDIFTQLSDLIHKYSR